MKNIRELSVWILRGKMPRQRAQAVQRPQGRTVCAA